jgi:hypothetical protein
LTNKKFVSSVWSWRPSEPLLDLSIAARPSFWFFGIFRGLASIEIGARGHLFVSGKGMKDEHVPLAAAPLIERKLQVHLYRLCDSGREDKSALPKLQIRRIGSIPVLVDGSCRGMADTEAIVKRIAFNLLKLWENRPTTILKGHNRAACIRRTLDKKDVAKLQMYRI